MLLYISGAQNILEKHLGKNLGKKNLIEAFTYSTKINVNPLKRFSLKSANPKLSRGFPSASNRQGEETRVVGVAV